MAEILQLDPFQMVRSWVAPEGGEQAPDRGWVTQLNAFSADVNLRWDCNPPVNCFLNPDAAFGAGYRHTLRVRVSAPITQCDQLVWNLTGTTSGFNYALDVNALHLAYGFICDDESRSCLVCGAVVGGIAMEIAVGSRWGSNGDKGDWKTIVLDDLGYCDVGLIFYTKSPLGFALNECLDVAFPSAPPEPLTSITDRAAGGSWVNMPGAGEFAVPPKLASYTVAGTLNYNGVWKVRDPETGRFWIDAPYVADEFLGNIQPYYQGPVVPVSTCP